MLRHIREARFGNHHSRIRICKVSHRKQGDTIFIEPVRKCKVPGAISTSNFKHSSSTLNKDASQLSLCRVVQQASFATSLFAERFRRKLLRLIVANKVWFLGALRI